VVSRGFDVLVLELRAAGVTVTDPWDLVATKLQYDHAVPLLLDWLRHVDERFTDAERSSATELLVRALTVPAAGPAATPTMLELFRTVEDRSGVGLRWVLGNALSVVADDSFFDEIADLIRRREYGRARQMLVLGLARLKDPRVGPLLVEVLDDDDVAAHAVIALGRLRPPDVRQPVEALLRHPSALVRREAKKTLGRLPDR
jgi:HEAT repeat protein